MSTPSAGAPLPRLTDARTRSGLFGSRQRFMYWVNSFFTSIFATIVGLRQSVASYTTRPMFLSASEGLYVYLPIADMRVVFTRRLRSETPWNDSVPIDLPGIPGSSPTTAGFVMSFMSTTSVGCAAMLLPTYRQSRTAVMPPFAPRGRLNLGSSSGLVATRVKFFIWPPAGILSIGVRGWTPLYDSGAGDEQAATINIPSGTREPHRANLFIDPPRRPRGREAGPSAAGC